MPEKPTIWFKVGALGHIVSVNLENEIKHMGNQSVSSTYVIEPNTNSECQVQDELLWASGMSNSLGNTVCILSHADGSKIK